MQVIYAPKTWFHCITDDINKLVNLGKFEAQNNQELSNIPKMEKLIHLRDIQEYDVGKVPSGASRD